MTGAEGAGTIRLDKWLWHARFFKTRSLAGRMVGDGAVRVNGTRVTKPATMVRCGDVLTFAQARRIRVVAVTGLGTRRGPAPEAQALYEDRSPPEAPGTGSDPRTGAAPSAPERGGRPEKKDRRAIDRLRQFPS